MLEKITKELIDGRKTYSVSGVAVFSNVFAKVTCPATIPEWTELFNLIAAVGAALLVCWRLFTKLREKKKG